MTDNPTVTGALGPRYAPTGERRAIDGRVDLMQPLNVPGQRRARVAAAEAAVEGQVASSDALLRDAEADVATAFFRTLAGQKREQLAATAEATAKRVSEALVRRHQLRDVALLDVNVGKTALARATALLRTSRAGRIEAETLLRRLLVLEENGSVSIAGDLRDQRRFSLPALVARASSRPGIRALIAEAKQADAEAKLAKSARWPRLAIGASYERDDGDDVVAGVVSVDLPLFNREQGPTASSIARAGRLRAEAEAALKVTASLVRGAHAVHQEHLAAAAALEEATPLLQQNDELAQKSYEAGQLSLADWMVVRRDGLDAHLEYLQQLLLAAEAGVALALTAGVSP